MKHTLDILLMSTMVAWVLAYFYRTQLPLNWMIKLVAFTFLILTFQIFFAEYHIYRILLDVALTLFLVWGFLQIVKTSGGGRILKSK